MFNFIDRFVIFFYLIQNYFGLKINFLVDFSLSWALLCSAGIDSWPKNSQFFDVELPALIQNLYFESQKSWKTRQKSKFNQIRKSFMEVPIPTDE